LCLELWIACYSIYYIAYSRFFGNSMHFTILYNLGVVFDYMKRKIINTKFAIKTVE